HIIRVANTGDAGYHHTAISVENDKLCRLSGYHEEAMVSFIERHRVVGLAGLQRPVRDRMRISMNNYNCRFRSYVGVDHRFCCGAMRGFGVSIDLVERI